MTIEEALSYIHGTLRFGSVPGLTTIRRLCRELGDPQKGLSYIHVAGTNGKGSTCAMISAIAQKACRKVGLYTSPALVRFNERIRVNGEEIPDEALCRLTARVKDAVDVLLAEGCPHPTEFELVTAIGFLYFAEQQCDLVVLEVGMGGRLDATNVIDAPRVAVITSISLDHTDRLGKTIRAIAGEKCGIIKPGCRTVTTVKEHPDALSVIRETADDLTVAPLPILEEETLSGITFSWEDLPHLSISLIGSQQLENAAAAIAAARAYGFSDDAIRKGLPEAVNPARMEIVRRDPLVILDGAHNPSAMEHLRDNLRRLAPGKKTLICGMLADKDFKTSAAIIGGEFSRIITVPVDSPRALSNAALAEAFSPYCADVTPMTLSEAVASTANDPVTVIAGSLYMAAEYKARF